MKYTHKYSKLDKKSYTTIRRYSKGKVGKGLIENYPGGQHGATIMKIERKPLVQISTEFLLADTDCENRQDAIDLIQSFYRTPINPYKDKLYIYYIRRSDHY